MAATALRRALPLLAPWIFVLIWSTGFIVARLGLPHAPPLAFLSLRFVGAILCLYLLVRLFKAQWPARGQIMPIALAGVLLQGGYLGGVWVAISMGLPAGLSALVVGLQPLLTGVFGGLTGEKVNPRQWVGLLLGFVGVLITVSSRWSVDGLAWPSMVAIVVALLAITTGTLYQKYRCGRFDTRTGAMIQYAASAAVTIPLALIFEQPIHIDPVADFLVAYFWSVIALSIGAIALLFWLIEQGEATRVTSLFYLSPPTTAVMAWLIFRERLDPTAIMGMGLAVVAVALVNYKK